MAVDVRENLERVRGKIAEAAARAGRDAREITLVAVTKGIPVDVIRTAFENGCRDLGENRVQELLVKQKRLAGVRWHFIGHLQRNKVRSLIEHVTLIHSLDRWNLAEEISRCAAARGLVVPVLIQVNVARETTKYGVEPEAAADLAEAAGRLPGLSIQGLMTIAPQADDPEEVRPVFRALRSLGREIAGRVPGFSLKYLSMGMSNDYTVAIEEGANLVRVGSAVFGARSAYTESRGMFTGG
ncbi:MAG: YggS family pyridoxal phosphate-dependent enzyme [Thermoanaerobacterales bacterium]|nr:YggS family pyridoxal phosphate-dependent enzyme [Bacillota bacterium]MDI6906514.1 YggS family pyridoxal phosphate-dependent enzyme [Thermoanaerobacterales bacterium]